ncbi:MAG: hypothetical protein WBG46_14450 [Nonlabens sp.]
MASILFPVMLDKRSGIQHLVDGNFLSSFYRDLNKEILNSSCLAFRMTECSFCHTEYFDELCTGKRSGIQYLMYWKVSCR